MMDLWLFWKLGLDTEEAEVVRQILEGCAPADAVDQPEPEPERMAA